MAIVPRGITTLRRIGVTPRRAATTRLRIEATPLRAAIQRRAPQAEAPAAARMAAVEGVADSTVAAVVHPTAAAVAITNSSIL